MNDARIKLGVTGRELDRFSYWHLCFNQRRPWANGGFQPGTTATAHPADWRITLMFTTSQTRQWQDIRLRALEYRNTKLKGVAPTRAERDRETLCDLLEIAVNRVRDLEQLSLFDDQALNSSDEISR